MRGNVFYMHMKIAVVQTMPVFGETRANVSRTLEQMETAPADCYVLPELFNTGYNFVDTHEVELLAEPLDGPSMQALHQFCRARGCYVVYGFAERAGAALYNSAAFIGPNGVIGRYRKVHLYYREKLFFAPGDLGFPVSEFPLGRLGIMICFDWIYPEAARTLALGGAQIIAHPSNLVLPHCPDAMVTRCLENRIFSATANRVGSEDRGGLKLSYIGRSEIVSPQGEILSRLDESNPGVATADIDLNEAANKSINEYNDLLRDRYPSSYQLGK